MEPIHHKLNHITTLGIEGSCMVIPVATDEDIKQIPVIVEKYPNITILGKGSNMIPDSSEIVFLKMETTGIHVINEDDNSVTIKIEAGHLWDDVVETVVDNNWYGIECMSAIPGTAGATPIQNVGAYGQEIADTFVELSAYDRTEKKWVTLKHDDCHFTYRKSIFNTTEKNRYIITSITLHLSKIPQTKEFYPALKKYLDENNITEPTLNNIRNAITNIRWSKLPKPDELANCGSFFHNPIIPTTHLEQLQKQFPTIVSFTTDSPERVKISAGWLLEHAGFKGVRNGNFGQYEKNALVLVHYGNGTIKELNDYISNLKEKVYELFQIQLDVEPEFLSENS
jgi:UDP-N-acetylmuramate dehydrogenase